MKVPKCPKCGKYPEELTQYAEEIMSVDVSPNGFISGNPESPYNVYHTKVIAQCTCGYKWKLRGIESASDFEMGDREYHKTPYGKRG